MAAVCHRPARARDHRGDLDQLAVGMRAGEQVLNGGLFKLALSKGQIFRAPLRTYM